MGLTEFGERLELRSEVEIAVEPSRVWNVLVDFTNHARWNPFWCNVRGNVAPAGRVDYELTPPGGSVMRVRRRIEQLEPAIQLRWQGRYGWGWLLRSEQFFRLAEIPSGRTRLVVGENLRGPGVTGKSELMMNIARGQALMNQAIKRLVEAG